MLLVRARLMMHETENLLEAAVKVIVKMNYASISLLSRRLHIDEQHATAILYQMEIAGYVSWTESQQTRFVKQLAYDYVRRKSHPRRDDKSAHSGKPSATKYVKEAITAYDVLGITADSSEQEIDTAYRTLVTKV
jgi:hypothetical protein